jgi:hypothetical protein
MPITFAHPVAAIPFRRPLGRFGVLSALVIGSMAPDLGYFAPHLADREPSHTATGLFWFCMPAGLVCYAVYHGLFRPLLYDLAPDAIRRRVLPSALPDAWSPTAIAAILVSLFFGAATHLVWDSMTHASGFVVERCVLLRAELFQLGDYPVHTFKLLQYASGILGMVILAAWAGYRLWVTQPHGLPAVRSWPLWPRVAAAVLLVSIPAVAALARAASAVGLPSTVSGWRIFTGIAVRSGGTALILALLALAFLRMAIVLVCRPTGSAITE